MLRIVLILLTANKIYASELSDAFDGKHNVRRVIPDTPLEELYVKFSSQNEPADLCEHLFHGDLSEPPNVKWNGSDDKYYTLIMAGYGSVLTAYKTLNWVVSNIPGNDISSGEVLQPYVFPVPPVYVSYIFLVYEQPGVGEFASGRLLDRLRKERRLRQGRLEIPINEFVEKHNFTRPPLAGNCMYYSFKPSFLYVTL